MACVTIQHTYAVHYMYIHVIILCSRVGGCDSCAVLERDRGDGCSDFPFFTSRQKRFFTNCTNTGLQKYSAIQ